MKRELILKIKNNNRNKKKVKQEIAVIKKILPYVESFKAFTENNELLDITDHVVVTDRIRMLCLYAAGVNSTALLLVCGKN